MKEVIRDQIERFKRTCLAHPTDYLEIEEAQKHLVGLFVGLGEIEIAEAKSEAKRYISDIRFGAKKDAEGYGKLVNRYKREIASMETALQRVRKIRARRRVKPFSRVIRYMQTHWVAAFISILFCHAFYLFEYPNYCDGLFHYLLK